MTDNAPTLRSGHGESDGITCPDGQLTAADAVTAIDWDARLRNAVAARVAAKRRRRNERTTLAENRDWGLRRRHAEKLARTTSTVAATATDEPGSTK